MKTTIETSKFVVVFYGAFNAVIPKDKNGLQKIQLFLMESFGELDVFVIPMLKKVQAFLCKQKNLPQSVEDLPVTQKCNPFL